MFSIKGLGIMAILTTLLLGAIVGLQAAEWSGYRAAPSVWSVRTP